MAFKWVQRVKGWVAGDTPEGTATDSQEGAPTTPPPAAESTDSSRLDGVLRCLPLFMLLAGAGISACGELLGLWALLGYLLLVTSPVVYWLSRIEQRLAKVLELQRKSAARADRR